MPRSNARRLQSLKVETEEDNSVAGWARYAARLAAGAFIRSMAPRDKGQFLPLQTQIENAVVDTVVRKVGDTAYDTAASIGSGIRDKVSGWKARKREQFVGSSQPTNRPNLRRNPTNAPTRAPTPGGPPSGNRSGHTRRAFKGKVAESRSKESNPVAKAAQFLENQGMVPDKAPRASPVNVLWDEAAISTFIASEALYMASKDVNGLRKAGINPSHLESYMAWAMEQRKMDIGLSISNYQTPFNKAWYLPPGLYGLLQYVASYREGDRHFTLSKDDTSAPAAKTHANANMYAPGTFENEEVKLAGATEASTFAGVASVADKCSAWCATQRGRQYCHLPKYAPDASAYASFAGTLAGGQHGDQFSCASDKFNPEITMLLVDTTRINAYEVKQRGIKRWNNEAYNNSTLIPLIRRGYIWLAHNALVDWNGLKFTFNNVPVKSFQYIPLTTMSSTDLLTRYLQIVRGAMVEVDKCLSTGMTNTEIASYTICCIAALAERCKRSSPEVSLADPWVPEGIKTVKFPLPVKLFLDSIGPHIQDGLLYTVHDQIDAIKASDYHWYKIADGTTAITSSALAPSFTYGGVAVNAVNFGNTPGLPIQAFPIMSHAWTRLINEASRVIACEVVDWDGAGSPAMAALVLHGVTTPPAQTIALSGGETISIFRREPTSIHFLSKPTICDLHIAMLGVCRQTTTASLIPTYPFIYDGFDVSGTNNLVESLMDAGTGESSKLQKQLDKLAEGQFLSYLPAGRAMKYLLHDHLAMDHNLMAVTDFNSNSIRTWIDSKRIFQAVGRGRMKPRRAIAA